MVLISERVCVCVTVTVKQTNRGQRKTLMLLHVFSTGQNRNKKISHNLNLKHLLPPPYPKRFYIAFILEIKAI